MAPSIINTWDQLMYAGGGVAISYYERASRSVMPARWRVWRIVEGKKVATDPKAIWFDMGEKSFTNEGGRTGKKDALLKAIAWAEQMYGPLDLVRNRLGDYLPRKINTQYPIPKGED